MLVLVITGSDAISSDVVSKIRMMSATVNQNGYCGMRVRMMMMMLMLLLLLLLLMTMMMIMVRRFAAD